MRACWVFGAFGFALLAGFAPAAEPVFVLTTTDGKTVKGAVEAVGEKGTVTIGKDAVAAERWVFLRRDGQRLPPFPEGPQLIFTNGDRLTLLLDKLALADEKFALADPRFGDGKPTAFPLAAVVLVWVQPPDDGDEPARLRRRLTLAKRKADVVAMRNGDLLEGVVNALLKGEVEMEIARKKVNVPCAKMSSLALSSELALPLKPKGWHARLVLADGSRLTVTDLHSDGKDLAGKTVFGPAFRVPLTSVAAVEARHDNIVYLSDLKPKSYQHTPYFSLKWAMTNDGSVNGGDILLSTGTHDKGLGLHSASRVTYAVPPGCTRFEALVGLDERTGKLGSVQVRVEVDGKAHALLDGKDLTPARGAVPVAVDVVGAKEITLVVEFGRGGDVGDHVLWADARLLK